MKIKTYLNTTPEDIKAKKFNIFIGVSLGNKFFTNNENIKEFTLWALDNTKNTVAILIPDKISAVNFKIRSGYSKNRAASVALRKGTEIKMFIERIVESLPLNDFQKSCIVILRWQDIENDTKYQDRKKILYEAFYKNEIFRSKIIDIVKENTRQNSKLKIEDYERLASYPLDELPVLIAGLEYNGIIYNLIPYPGISEYRNFLGVFNPQLFLNNSQITLYRLSRRSPWWAATFFFNEAK